MYNDFGATGNFFDFRSMSGLQINRYTDIPYDFYTLVPTYLQPLYYGMLRERQWDSGYVPNIHNRLLRSNIVPTVNSIIVNRVLSDGYKFEGKDDAVNVIEKWNKRTHFRDTLERLFHNANMLGFAFMKLDRCNGEIIPTVVPADQCYYIFQNGQIVDAKIVVAYYIGNGTHETTFLMEHRYYDPDTGKPMIRHFFTTSKSQFSENASDLRNFSRGLNLNIPLLEKFGIKVQMGENFKSKLAQMGIYIDPEELDFATTGLGIEIVNASAINPTYIKMPIGQGLVDQIGEDNLIKYEIANSLVSHELNIAPSIVMVPQEFNSYQLNDPFRTSSIGVNNGVRPISKTYFVRVPFGDDAGNTNKPEQVQFTIRSKEILDMKNSALKDIALSVGLNPSDLGVSKDAAVYVSNKETSQMQDMTNNMVNCKRRQANKAIQMVLDEILAEYGYESGAVSIKWTDMPMGSLEDLVATLSMAVKNRLISTKEARRELFGNRKTMVELEQMEREIEEDMKAIQETYYAGGDNAYNDSVAKSEV